MSEVKRYHRDDDEFERYECEFVVDAKDFDRVTAERDAERRRADVAVADANAADAAGKKVSGLLSNRTAELDSLQALLTATDERADVLEGLVGEVLDAVGREPLDLDAVLRLRARMRAALKPADAVRNQCDGCQAGIPLVNGAHRMGKPGGYPDTMSCTAKLYKPAEGRGISFEKIAQFNDDHDNRPDRDD